MSCDGDCIIHNCISVSHYFCHKVNVFNSNCDDIFKHYRAITYFYSVLEIE